MGLGQVDAQHQHGQGRVQAAQVLHRPEHGHGQFPGGEEEQQAADEGQGARVEQDLFEIGPAFARQHPGAVGPGDHRAGDDAGRAQEHAGAAQQGFQQGQGHKAVVGKDQAHLGVFGIGGRAAAIEQPGQQDSRHITEEGKEKRSGQHLGLPRGKRPLEGGDEHRRRDDVEQQGGELLGALAVDGGGRAGAPPASAGT